MAFDKDNGQWEHFTHEADIGIRGIGTSLENAFEMAAYALTAVVTHPDNVAHETAVHIQCAEPDVELLFLDWINALIYEMDTRQMIFSDFHVQIHDSKLTADIRGEKINRQKHDPAVDIKGATMTELKVSNDNNLWIAQCVVDV